MNESTERAEIMSDKMAPATAPPVIRVEAVSKTFNTRRGFHHALERVDLSIDNGEFLCLLGPSGCGKSTLLNLIAGLEKPDEGSVHIGGRRVTAPGPDRCVMFQDAALFPWMSVAKNVEFALEMSGVARGEWAGRVERHLRMVHLWKFRDAQVHELSGGMRQRAALARALAPDPKVLLMDEPFASLDAQTRDVLHAELAEVWRSTKKTVVFVTHNVREAVRLGDRVVLLATRPGRVKAEWRIDLARPRETEGDVAYYVGRIMKELRVEIDKVMREEIGDAWEPAQGGLPGGPAGGLGDGI